MRRRISKQCSADHQNPHIPPPLQNQPANLVPQSSAGVHTRRLFLEEHPNTLQRLQTHRSLLRTAQLSPEPNLWRGSPTPYPSPCHPATRRGTHHHHLTMRPNKSPSRQPRPRHSTNNSHPPAQERPQKRSSMTRQPTLTAQHKDCSAYLTKHKGGLASAEGHVNLTYHDIQFGIDYIISWVHRLVVSMLPGGSFEQPSLQESERPPKLCFNATGLVLGGVAFQVVPSLYRALVLCVPLYRFEIHIATKHERNITPLKPLCATCESYDSTIEDSIFADIYEYNFFELF